ncbi:alpha-D-mannose-specific plant lectins domain-containing protein [Dioscorea alata]|uniref:Alpha-D-mannose-specific plant lectins domain-containing protein n=1 Tax=Dioscorea alata TaxID=55571 RepID=A0ACB7VBY9_DIOAL|nr:alpha-D-mannose-specific plant lectins domain-containing protein [Dioscorea alata]
MAHHHLLPLILALILLILPSSSLVQETPALFSDSNLFLIGGNNLTHGIYTLSLENNCSLIYYEKGVLTKDYNTAIEEAAFCQLSVTKNGQLSLETGDGNKPRLLGEAYDLGEYALIFGREGLSVCGPSTWNNSIPRPNEQTLKNKNLRATTSSNVIYSPNRRDGNANGDTLLATNKDASVYITQYCALSVNHRTTGENIWNSNSSSAEPLDSYLYLTERGELFLQYQDSEGRVHTQWTGGAFAEVNDYVLVLRFYGGLDIFGFKINVREIPPYSGSVAGNIKMVTA